MSNTIKQRPLEAHIAEMVNVGFDPKGSFIKLIQDLTERADKILTNKGEVQPLAPIKGRTEGIGTTVQHVDSVGNLASLANVNNTLTDLLTDGTGSPLTGGKRGFVALDTNNRLAGSFRANAVNVSATPTSSTVLSNDGISHAIVIAASTAQFGDGTVSYNSGSVDPGVFGTFYIYADDGTFAGGGVTYQFSTSPVDQTGANGRVLFGKIITVGGTPKTGGGSSGGTTPGGSGGRGFIQG